MASNNLDLDIESLKHLEKDAGRQSISSDSSDNDSTYEAKLSAAVEIRGLLEGQDKELEPASDKDKAYEDTISTRVKLVVLTTYLALTIAITLSTKAVIQHLKTPWMLTALHSTFTAFGCNILLWSRGQKFTRLCLRDNLVMLAFSSLFTINIAVSNISLGMVSVPFYQTVRSASPFCTVAIYRVVFGRKYSTATHMALLPIVLGVCMMTYGDYSFTAAGFFMTALGVVMASVKTITTNKILTGSRSLDSIEVLARMSPLAAVQSAFLGVVVGEVSTIADAFDQGGMTLGFCVGLLANCILALLLNISSFKVNKLAGALAQTVSGNVKQALTILLAIPIFGVQVGLIDGLGMATTLAGAMAFSFAELRARS